MNRELEKVLDHFIEFRTLIFKVDTICDKEHRARLFINNKEFIEKALASLEAAKDWNHLGVILKVLANEHFNSPIPLFSSPPSKELCSNLKNNENEIKNEN